MVNVERYLKGGGPDEIVANDPSGQLDCGFMAESFIGKRLVFFLQGEESPFDTNVCLGNRVLGEAGSQSFLRDVEAILGSDSDDGPPWLSIGLGIGLGAVVAAGSAFIFKQHVTKQD